MPIDVLYPYLPSLQEQGGEDLGEIPMAIWEDDTTREDRGQYYTMLGEAPIDYAGDLLVKNRQVVFNNTPFRIVDPFTVFSVPRVRVTLRGPRV